METDASTSVSNDDYAANETTPGFFLPDVIGNDVVQPSSAGQPDGTTFL
jgi:hypothetical protein